MEDNKPKFNFWQKFQKYMNQEKKDLSSPFTFDGTLDKSFFTNPRKFIGVKGDIIPDSEWEKTYPYDFGNPDNPYNPANRYTLEEPLQDRGNVDFKNMRLLSRDKRLLPKEDVLPESNTIEDQTVPIEQQIQQKLPEVEPLQTDINTFQDIPAKTIKTGYQAPLQKPEEEKEEDPFGINSLDISLPEEYNNQRDIKYPQLDSRQLDWMGIVPYYEYSQEDYDKHNKQESFKIQERPMESVGGIEIPLLEEPKKESTKTQYQFDQVLSPEKAPLRQWDDLRAEYQNTLIDNSVIFKDLDLEEEETTPNRPSLNEMILAQKPAIEALQASTPDPKVVAGVANAQDPSNPTSVAKAMSENNVSETAQNIIETTPQVGQTPAQNVAAEQSSTQNNNTQIAPKSTNTQVWLENLGIIDNPMIEKPSATLNEETVIKGTEAPEKTPFSEKFDNSTFGKHNALWNAGLDGLNQASDLILGEKRGYDGTYGNLTRGLDTTYNAVEDFAGNFGAVGKTIQLVMKANKLLGGIANKAGAGTDGLTATDAVLNSSFLALTPFGLVNGIGSPTTDTFRKNTEAFAQVGQGFGGIDDLTSDVSNYAGKKVGNFSMGAFNDFQSYIQYAKGLQRNLEKVAQNTQDKQDILNYMSPMIGSRYEFETSGGLNPGIVHRGKEGMVLRPMDQLANYAKQVNPRWVQRLSEPRMTVKIKDGEYSHILKWVTDGEGNAIVYPEIQEVNGELRHLGKSAYKEALRSGNYLIMSPEEAEMFTTYYKEQWPDYFNSVSNTKIKPIIPEVVPTRISSTIPEYAEQVINPIPPNYEEEIIEFKQGGSFNIIPDGALHANLHHMDNMDITRKGIPVVSIGEDGNLEQQAEIEREEVIFRLEVTKKLESLMKDYEADYFTQEEKDWFAIQAGKLLVYELLENTVDNTGILK